MAILNLSYKKGAHLSFSYIQAKKKVGALDLKVIGKVSDSSLLFQLGDKFRLGFGLNIQRNPRTV